MKALFDGGAKEEEGGASESAHPPEVAGGPPPAKERGADAWAGTRHVFFLCAAWSGHVPEHPVEVLANIESGL